MHSTHYWLIGCALCIASMGVAAATTGEAQDVDSSAHSVTDGGAAHEGASGGDMLGAMRDSEQHNAGTETPANPSSTGDRAGSARISPTHPHQPHVGWQSLLPGSIQ